MSKKVPSRLLVSFLMLIFFCELLSAPQAICYCYYCSKCVLDSDKDLSVDQRGKTFTIRDEDFTYGLSNRFRLVSVLHCANVTDLDF